MRLLLPLVLVTIGTAAAAPKVEDGFFSEELYPVFLRAQCNLCHNDNGVASGTRFEFPPNGASKEQVEAFGMRLAKVVNSSEPKASLLYLKPTNRAQHPGGERIKQGSAEEELLLAWVSHLASLAESDLAEASGEGGAASLSHELTVRRLTHSQYNNAVRDLLGELSRPADQFPPEDYIHGFKNQSHGQSTSPLLMEAYSAAAEKVAANAFRGGARPGLLPCDPVGAGDAVCHERFVREFGLRAFRRPLTEDEARRYSALSIAAANAEEAFEAGPQLVVEAMLQSPSFLMRVEHGSDGKLYDFEVASKLAFFLWDTIPDVWLLGLAEDGKLHSPEQVKTAAQRMLDHPRARAAMDEFLGQWMRFDRALTTIRDRKFYPQFNSELAEAMTEETRRLFRHVVWEDRSFLEFFTADYSFIDGRLAEVYGLKAPEDGFGLVRFPEDSQRAGVLGQAMFLTLTSKPSDTSPTERGLFVREHFLCQAVPPPPPGVNAALPPLTDERPLTNRERLKVHLSSEACSSCHRLIDPIGLGLEHFDAIGQYRAKHHVKIPPTRDQQKRKIKTKATEYDLDIDATAEIVGIRDSGFTSPKELGAVLAGDEGCRKCVVKQLFRYAMGRPEELADRPAIDAALGRFEATGFRFRELIVALALSPAFLETSAAHAAD